MASERTSSKVIGVVLFLLVLAFVFYAWEPQVRDIDGLTQDSKIKSYDEEDDYEQD